MEKVLNEVTVEIKSVTGLGKKQTVHQNRLMHFQTQGKEDILQWSTAYDDLVKNEDQNPEKEQDWVDTYM